MAPTLLLTDDHASKLSQHSKMPQVFVVPPEEDDTPAWCCFDASVSDSPRHVLQEDFNAPSLHCDLKELSFDTISIPKSNDDETSSIMNDDYMESNGEMDFEDFEQEPDLTESEDVGNDSEVVEVVKVGRYTDVEEQYRTSTPPPQTKSLRARASRALQTFKNAGKGSLRSKTKAQIILPPSKTEEGIKTPISRRSSAIFSQISSSPTALRFPPSVSSFDLVEVSSIPPLEGPRYPSSLRNVSPSSEQPLSPLISRPSSNATSPSHRSFSHNPTTQTTSNRRNFSVMSLNRIFSFSKSGVSDSVPISRSRNSSGPSTGSSSGLETPTEESTPPTPEVEQGDISFEMRLDSLHFDSLSFDLDGFLNSSHS